MRLTLAIALLCTLWLGADAFVVLRTSLRVESSSHLVWAAAVELEPEPDGGDELSPRKSLPDCRMKKLDPRPDIKSTDGEVFDFWMTAVADGELIKSIRAQILKDAAKKANFPGFRKGQVPPYAQPQITNFAIQEAIIKTIEASVEGFGLKSLPGSDGEVEVKEDVSAMAKGYKTGDSLAFTATLRAVFDPELVEDGAPASDVVDVEAVEEA